MYLAKNNAFSVLASSITNVQTTLTVQTGHGDRFPVVAGSDYTLVTLEDTSGNIEIVKVTARTAANDTMTIVRAQESTTAASFASGTIVSLRPTAGVIQNAISNSEAHIASTSGAHAASSIANTPAGNIAATTVQNALNELDSEKQAVSGKDTTGGYAGLTLFKLNLVNAANTFVNFLTNASTAARTWTMPDKDGTVAMLSDITGTNSGTNTGDQTLPTLGSLGAQSTANKDASGGYAGLTLFKINFRNVANTFTSFFTNSNTAARTYTFKDADGTVAFTSDITGTNSGTNTGDQTNVSGSAATFTSTTQNSQFNSVGVGTAASATAGEIRATNNITAYYSDGRLKNIIGKISNALEAVKSLDGVRYQANAIAGSFGYNTERVEVGVIAQQVRRVLPEIVVPAPFDIAQHKDGTEYSKSGQDYLTVHYERLVPLLIEAIKELTLKVEALERK